MNRRLPFGREHIHALVAAAELLEDLRYFRAGRPETLRRIADLVGRYLVEAQDGNGSIEGGAGLKDLSGDSRGGNAGGHRRANEGPGLRTPSDLDSQLPAKRHEKMLLEFWHAVSEWERLNQRNDITPSQVLAAAYERAQEAYDDISAELTKLRGTSEARERP